MMTEKREKSDVVYRFRAFLNVTAEERFLNRMGLKKFFLAKAFPFLYVFRRTDEVWSYSMEWLDSSPMTEENQQYIAIKTAGGPLQYCCKRGCFAFFAWERNVPPEKSPEAVSAIKKRYRSLFIFWSIVSAFALGLIAYNLAWALKFKEMGYKVWDNPNEIEKAFQFVVGKNPAALFLYFLIPIAALLLSFAAVYFIEYMYWFKKGRKKIKKKQYLNLETAVDTDEKS